MRLAIVAAICAALASGQEVQRPRLTGVAHIGLYAHDIEKSRAFYTDFLGFQEVFPQKNADGSLLLTFFKINDRQYVEMFPERQAGTDRLAHIAIETDDAAGLLEYLASRGVKTPDRLSKGRTGNTSFNVTDPDGHTVEFVLYDKFPSLTQLGVFHHIGLLDPDMGKVAARLEAQPGRKAYTRPIDVRGGRRRQIQVYDPDGSRTEAMEPVPADAPLVNSTAPPVR